MLKKTDDQLRDFYQSKELSIDRMHDVLIRSDKVKRKRESVIWAMAAMLVLGLSLVFMQQQWVGNDRTSIAVNEASTNHVTKLEFEFESNTMVQLDKKMDKLSFALRLPELAALEAMEIEGARYCTISGKLAAHLKFIHPDTQQQYSLFVTPDVGNIRTIADTPARVNGVDVQLWREKGMFYALAHTDQV